MKSGLSIRKQHGFDKHLNNCRRLLRLGSRVSLSVHRMGTSDRVLVDNCQNSQGLRLRLLQSSKPAKHMMLRVNNLMLK